MLSYVFAVVAAYLLYCVVSFTVSFRRNLHLARKSGIHYIVVPVFWVAQWWLVTQALWFKLLAYLPNNWTRWVDFCVDHSTFDYGHEIFNRIGHDTFLLVSPGSISMFTCEPSVISQITARRNDFPKPVYIYKGLDIYGKNVVSSEGQHWRQHRKATSPPFTEKNNHLVWTESVKYAQSMLDTWLGPDGTAGPMVDRIMDDTMRLSLYVISGAGFGRSLVWPSKDSLQAGIDGHSKIQNLDNDRGPGHSMSWTFALHTLLDTILLQIIFPHWVLEKIPTKTTKKTMVAYEEWGKYMKEALEKAKTNRQETGKDEVDILGQLVKSQLDAKGGTTLTESEILGNMFVLILAGHETAANSLHFTILYLALNPGSQRRLQQDLDKIFGGKPPSEWQYDRDLPALFGGMAGAILAEELRMVPPVVNIPKSTYGVKDQPLMVEDKECVVPAEAYVSLCTVAAAKNPKYWPIRKPTLPGGHTAHPVANLDNDLEEFHPERWFMTDARDEAENMQKETLAGGDLVVNTSADTSEKLYRPVKGSYVPFSDGYRACLGRRFAQVEVLAVLAVLYQNFSIELAVDKYASDEQVLKMGVNDRAEVWQKAAEDARNLMRNGMGTIITLQMRKGTVPVRVVPRSQERFVADIDEIWKANHPEKISDKGIPGWSNWNKKKNSNKENAA